MHPANLPDAGGWPHRFHHHANDFINLAHVVKGAASLQAEKHILNIQKNLLPSLNSL
jgi:hypothetical protein